MNLLRKKSDKVLLLSSQQRIYLKKHIGKTSLLTYFVTEHNNNDIYKCSVHSCLSIIPVKVNYKFPASE